MKFGDKYELLESLSTGAVETFAANDKIRGERVLVHILECAPPKPDQSTTESVLASFRRVAPEPVGPVLETGRYNGPYAYLVTKAVDDAAVRNWVRLYEIQGLDTQETRTNRSKPAEGPLEPVLPPLPPIPAAPKESSPAPVSVTQLLRDFDSQYKPPAKPKEVTPPRQPLPNLTVGGQNSGLHAAPPWEPVRASIPTQEKEKEQDTFGVRFTGPAASEPKRGVPSANFPSSQSPVSAVQPGSARPGEFTSFFQGPFRGDGPSDMPAVSSQPIEPPRKAVGEFTAVFGASGARPEPTPSVAESGNNPSPTSFTAIFKDMEAPPRSFNTSTPLPPPPSVLAPPAEPFPVATPKETLPPPVVATPGPVIPPLNSPVLPMPPVPSAASPSVPVAKPAGLPGDGATNAFSRPVADEPALMEAPAPVGPSPYTQIISRDKLMAQAAEAEAGGNAAAPAGAGFGPPPMPKMPAPPPLKMPPAPPMPKIAAPSAPKAPKMPKVDAPLPPPVSYMPLVITLLVLFFLAVLLVMYFWLKGH